MTYKPGKIFLAAALAFPAGLAAAEQAGTASFSTHFHSAYYAKDMAARVDLYTKALDLWTEADGTRNKASAYYNRGVAYQQLERHEEAVADFDKAIKLRPSDAVVYNNRGYSRLWLGKGDGAKADFEKAIRLSSVDPLPYCNLAGYHWAYKRDAFRAMRQLELCFKKGFDQWDDLKDESADGHFLKGLNDTEEFGALVKKYRKDAPAGKRAKAANARSSVPQLPLPVR